MNAIANPQHLCPNCHQPMFHHVTQSSSGTVVMLQDCECQNPTCDLRWVTDKQGVHERFTRDEVAQWGEMNRVREARMKARLNDPRAKVVFA